MESANATKDFMAGCLGGLAGVLVSYPLDTVKVHLQTQDVNKPKYKGTWHCLAKLLKDEGAASLYRGITSPMAGIGAINAIVFGIYGNVLRAHKDPDSLTSHAVAGGVAGLFQSFACSPMELAKIRMQLQSKTYAGQRYDCPLEYILCIRRRYGFSGTMRGLGFTIIRDIPGFAIYFASYEYFMRQPWKVNTFYCLAVGGLAGCFSWLGTYPVDVVKTCIQADDPMHMKYKGYPDCIMRNYKSGGLLFFFRGMGSTMIRSFPMNTACFYVVTLINGLGKYIFKFNVFYVLDYTLDILEHN